MSYDVSVEINTGRDWHPLIYIGNYTCNVARMWTDALSGVSLREFDGAPCSEAGGPLAAGVKRMEAEPARYRDMNPSNGWGDYEGALDYLRRLADACAEHPAGRISVWA